MKHPCLVKAMYFADSTVATVMMVVFSILLMAACHENPSAYENSVICTQYVAPSIEVEVLDQDTGLAISCGAVLIVQDGDYYEEVSNPSGADCNDGLILSGAPERPGIYDVTVLKDGYVNWSRTNVEVTKNICHVNTITLQAYLSK